MVTLRLLPLGVLALLLAAPPTLAQQRIRLVEPTLLVGDRLYPVVAPMEEEAFGHLGLSVPGLGRYLVSDRPFDGARRAGQFHEATLAFTVDGRSFRLRTAEPMLSGETPVYAFVAHQPAGDARDDGRAFVRVYPQAPGAVASTASRERGTSRHDRLVATRELLRRDLALYADQSRRYEAERARLQDTYARLAAGRPSAYGEREAYEADLLALERERERLRAEHMRLDRALQRLEAETLTLRRSYDARLGQGEAPERPARAAPSPTPTGDRDRLHTRIAAAETERDEAALRNAALRRERDDLAERLRALEAEHDALRTRRARLEENQVLLAAERDALHREAEALRAELLAREGAPAITLPGFDWTRLRNADEIGALLHDLDIPQTAPRIGGDALVLFATDDEGRVTEATVTEPLGHGFDALAERIVLAMAFEPPVVDGIETGFRSQVVVRFRP